MRKLITILILSIILLYAIYAKDIFIAHVVVLFFICFYDLLKGFYKTGTLRLLDFKNYFLLYYFYIYGFGYFSYRARESIGINVFDLNEALILHALQISIIAVLLLLFAYNVTIKRSIKLPAQRLEAIFLKLAKVRINSWYRIPVAALALFTYMWYLMGTIPFLTPEFHRTVKKEVGAGLGLIEALCLSLLNATLLFYIWFFLKKKTVDKTFVIFLSLNLFIFVINDYRGALMGYLISIAMVYYYLVKPFSIKHYFAGFVMIALIAAAIGAHRSGTLSGAGSSGMLSMGAEIATETAVEFDNYVETFEMFKHQDYLHGSTLVPIVTLPIPRAIFPDKNKYLTAGEYFKDYHNHTYISVGERLSYVGELFMNWGYIGIVCGMLLLGIIIGMVQNRSERISSVIGFYFSIQFIISLIGLIPGDIASVAVGFFTSNIVLIMYAILKRKNI